MTIERPSRVSVPALAAPAALMVFALSAAQVLFRYLLTYPGELWQLDLEVYRDGATSLLIGRPVYDWLTGAPQFLPFTYPPFSAIAAIPLALVPFAVAGWAWSAFQLVLLWWSTGIAFRPLIERAGPWGTTVQALLAAVLVHLAPVADGFRFGQVNAVVVALCLADAARRGVERDRWWPTGSLVGLAAAIKLTPAAFWLHYAVARRWRALGASLAAAAGATLVTAAVAPSASVAFWTDAMWDPARLGPNAGVSNQSVRGALLRIGPSTPAVQSVVWLVIVAVIGVLGYGLSVRLHRIGQPVAVVAAVGMVAVLMSPVSWIHHWHWGIAVIGALIGDGRVRARQIAAAAVTVVLLLPLPWWGGSWPGHGPLVSGVGHVVEQSYTLLAVAALVLLWRLVARPALAADAGSHRGGDSSGRQEREHREDGAHRGADAAHAGQADEAQ
ncbi:MAG: DUF2029 domain-containing protein [Kineosporiaceae bacterium]|nr:DUF2029 domain-containing protein [Kineosporiaceae bacterium]